MAKDKWVKVGNRIMDTAYLRDGNIVHTGEILLVALLLHTKSKRNQTELEQVSKMMNDQNLNRKRTPRKK